MKKQLIITRIIIGIGLLALFIPYIYSVYYSMPANDDFAWALEWFSTNRLVEVGHRVVWNYMNYFGQSGIFAIIVQVLFNPLYWFKNAGHSFGICMIIVFLLVAMGTLWAVRYAFKYMTGVENDVIADVFTFFVALLLFTSYYYSDVYNWWSGVPGYSMMMVCQIFTIGAIAKYIRKHDAKTYRNMIILGMITCTSMMYCIPTGLFYLVYVCLYNRKDGDSVKKKLIPLGLYILSGVLMVIAPGNSARMGSEQSLSSQIIGACVVSAKRVITRANVTVQTKPWVWMLLLLLVAMGAMATEKKVQAKLSQVCLSCICVFIAAWGAILPYVYGSNKTIDSEFTPRIYFVEDYIVFIGIAFVAFRLGQYINSLADQKITVRAYRVASLAIIVVGLVFCKKSDAYLQIIPLDIEAKADVMKESWYLWDGIMNEVKQAAATTGEAADVVIERENVDWCQYSYYTSMDDIPKDPVTEDYHYGNCNQCASKYFGVRSVVVYLY